MNYSEATQAGYTATEAEYQAIESLIADQYAAALSDIDARLAKLYADYASAKTTDDIYNWLIQFDRYGKPGVDVRKRCGILLGYERLDGLIFGFGRRIARLRGL